MQCFISAIMSIYMNDVNDQMVNAGISVIQMSEINGYPDIHSDIPLIVL